MNAFVSQNPTPLVRLKHPLFERSCLQVWIKRDDLNHPSIQGNKWHKLKYNVKAAQQLKRTCLLTFGGAYSNHIAATAAAAAEAGLKSIGIIRGEELADNPERWSHTLQRANQLEMQLQFVSRKTYRLRHDKTYLTNLQQQFPNAYLLPEGGTNQLAVNGFDSLMHDIHNQCPDWTHIITPVGTGGTLAGLIKHAPNKPQRHIWGIAVLKQANYLLDDIKQWIPTDNQTSWKLWTEFHYGGYAKNTAELLDFKQQVEAKFDVPLDPIYTTKMMKAFFEQLENQSFPRGAKIILLHTGGLQGNLAN